MKKYKFLLKPLLFIFNMLFATWLVVKIEQLSPTDFTRYKPFFGIESKPKENQFQKKPELTTLDKPVLKKLCSDYKLGLIDSVRLDKELDFVLNPGQEVVASEK